LLLIIWREYFDGNNLAGIIWRKYSGGKTGAGLLIESFGCD